MAVKAQRMPVCGKKSKINIKNYIQILKNFFIKNE